MVNAIGPGMIETLDHEQQREHRHADDIAFPKLPWVRRERAAAGNL